MQRAVRVLTPPMQVSHSRTRVEVVEEIALLKARSSRAELRACEPEEQWPAQARCSEARADACAA